jgi:hypothetical protein
MSIRKVLDLQNEFKKRLEQHSPSLNYSVPFLLYKIIECDDDILNFTLGSLGLKLRQFAQHVDFHHPEIVSIFDGIIANDHQFAQECMELLVLGKYAKENNLQKIIPSLGKALSKNSLSGSILKKIDLPQNNRMHVRLLKESKEREEIRMTKRMQTIDLQGVFRKGKNIWEAQPDNFTKFLRFDTAYQDDLNLAEKKAQRYDELGCVSLADEVRKSIEAFKEHMENSYYGFNRITMTSVALILAKSLNYTYLSTESNSWNYLCDKITVNPKFFGQYNFDPNRALKFSPSISLAAGESIFCQKKIESYDYEPRVYPLHEFNDIMTGRVKDTISFLEAFPDANNKPIFDHFGIIVPGVSLFSQNQSDYSFLNENGMIQSYAVREDAVKALDAILIKGKYFHPIILGERDNKCYFVCYWS